MITPPPQGCIVTCNFGNLLRFIRGGKEWLVDDPACVGVAVKEWQQVHMSLTGKPYTPPKPQWPPLSTLPLTQGRPTGVRVRFPVGSYITAATTTTTATSTSTTTAAITAAITDH